MLFKWGQKYWRWHRYFAWKPVWLSDWATYAWGETVWRRNTYDGWRYQMALFAEDKEDMQSHAK